MDSTLTDAMLLRASIFAQQEMYVAAMRDLEAVVELKPEMTDVWLQIAKFKLTHFHDYTAAVAACDMVVKRHPGKRLAYHVRAMSLSAAGEPERALYDLNRLIRMNPVSPWPYLFRGHVLLKRNRGRLALYSYMSWVEGMPRNADTHARRGRAYKILREFNKAVEEFTAAVASNPSVENLCLLSEALQAVGDMSGALQAIQLAIDAHPDGPKGLLCLAHCFESMGEYTMAIRHYDKSLESALQLYGEKRSSQGKKRRRKKGKKERDRTRKGSVSFSSHANGERGGGGSILNSYDPDRDCNPDRDPHRDPQTQSGQSSAASAAPISPPVGTREEGPGADESEGEQSGPTEHLLFEIITAIYNDRGVCKTKMHLQDVEAEKRVRSLRLQTGNATVVKKRAEAYAHGKEGKKKNKNKEKKKEKATKTKSTKGEGKGKGKKKRTAAEEQAAEGLGGLQDFRLCLEHNPYCIEAYMNRAEVFIYAKDPCESGRFVGVCSRIDRD